MKHNRLIRPSTAVLAVALSSMALYACGQNNGQSATSNTTADASGVAPPALPLTTGAETAPAYAPTAGALPAAPRPRIVRVASQADQYAYVDQASSMGAALGQAPPDYGFDYDGVRPWVWRTSNNAARLVEPIDGGYRYYFYQPGASEPYLIRDPQYAYGFSNGQLVVVYDARGNVLPPQYMDRQADDAGRYLARARALYNASLNSQRRSVIAANWAARRAQIEEQQAEWNQQQSQYAAWQDYHQQHEADQQAYWQAERQRRDAVAARFDQWHDAGYQGPPPPPAYGPLAGAAGAALIGGAIGGYLAGRDHHDDRNAPQGGPGYPPQNGGGYPNGNPGNPGSGSDPRSGYNQRSGPAPDQNQGAAIAEARRQQAQADAARQTQMQQQAQAASAAREQAIVQGRTQQAAADAARQAEAQRQANAMQVARSQQARTDASAQAQARAPAQAQAIAARQTQEAAHAQTQTQAVATRQAQDAARAQAMQAHAQQAAQITAQHQAAAQAQALQAHEQQAAQAAAAQAAAAHAGQAQMEAARKAQAAAAHPQPEGAHPPGEHPRRPGEGAPPAQP
jgi:hypothetical protein